MKKVFYKVTLALFISALFVSCASIPSGTKATMEETQVSLNRDQYTIIGRITESATVIASNSAIKREVKNYATGIKEINKASLKGDDGNYGFIGSNIPSNMSVKERAIALATYKLLNVAKYNNADALIYVTQDISVKRESGAKSSVTATVSALAVKVKADVEAEIPVVETIPEEEETVAESAVEAEATSTEETAETEVVEE